MYKNFGDFQAIKGVDFSIEEGKLVGLLGPSGGGKTSILRMLAGLEEPSSGQVILNGKVANGLTVQEREIGFVFQNYALFKHMTVFENVAYGLKVKKVDKARIKQRVEELLELMGLAQTINKYPHQLSGGQKQRVAFARALAPKPKLLLLDEPFAAIDAKVRKDLRLWLRNVISEFGITTIFVTHDQDEAIEVADELLIINSGKVEQQGTPWDIYHRPASRFVAEFLGNSNQLISPVTLKGFEILQKYQDGQEWKENSSVFIRPEWIEIRPLDVSYQKNAGETAEVTHVHFRGDAWYIELQLADLKLFTSLSINAPRYQVGDQVNLLIHKLSIFSDVGNEIAGNSLLNVSLSYHI
nr:ABC transporter ATP-binding protein [Gracilibacillus alcaliphilus]